MLLSLVKENKILSGKLWICANICFGCSKAASHWDAAFEYPQHMFWLRNSYKLIFYYSLLSWGLYCIVIFYQSSGKSWIWYFLAWPNRNLVCPRQDLVFACLYGDVLHSSGIFTCLQINQAPRIVFCKFCPQEHLTLLPAIFGQDTLTSKLR